jgi:hypothetical protein
MTRPIRRVDYAGHCGGRSTSSSAARVSKVHRRGAQVLLLRPGAAQLAEYPINFLHPAGAEQIGRDAYTHTTEQLNGLAARKLLRNARRDMRQH